MLTVGNQWITQHKRKSEFKLTLVNFINDSNQDIIYLLGKMLSTVIVFFCNGVASLLGWNAILNSLDYLASAYPENNVYSLIPIPVFVGYLLVALSYHEISKRMKYVTMIVVGIVVVNISLIALLVCSIVLKKEEAGFYITLFLCWVLGMFSNLAQLTYFAMINYLTSDVVSKFTIGTAVSGLGLTIARMIIVAILGSNPQELAPIIIYFAVALIFNVFTILMNIQFCKSTDYLQKINPFIIQEQKKDIQNIKQTLHISSQQEAQIKQTEQIENKPYYSILWQTAKEVFPFDLLILLNYVITFTLFPGPTLNKTFTNLDRTWSNLIFLLMYGIGDTVGKKLADFPWFFNKQSTIYLLFSRLFFFFTLTYLANGAANSDPSVNNEVWPFLNQLLFGITNGMMTNFSFILAFGVCHVKYKKYAGVLCGICLQVGIMIGTALELGEQKVFY